MSASLWSHADPRAERAPRWLAYVLLAAAWIATHPYYGIVHDGRLYLVQALKAADPSFLSDDLYFAFGSQDSFTRFSGIYALLLSQVSAAVAHWLATLAGQTAWFAAMAFLVRTLFGGAREFVVATAAVIALNPIYGGHHVFGYGEPFATPRLYVEALVMAGLALGLRGRPIGASLCMSAGMVLHPLMALPGIAVLAFLVGWHDRRMWLAAVVALGAALGLALAGVEPFTRALQAFDSAWFEVALQRSPFAFVTQWRAFDVADLASKAAIFVMALRVANASERRVLLAVGIVAAGALTVALVGGDLARNVLIGNLQPWRAMWVAAVLANAWTALIVLRLPSDSVVRHLLVLAIACNVTYRLIGLTDLCSPVIVLLAYAAWFTEKRNPSAFCTSVGVVAPALAVVFVGISAAILASIAAQIGEFARLARPFAAAAVGGIALGLLVWTASGRLWRGRWLVPVGIAVFLTAVALGDRRTDWTRFVEGGGVPEDLSRFMADAGMTYWEGGPELLWIKMSRPSYYSCLQGTGSIFYRGTAREYQRRGIALSALNTADFARSNDGECTVKQDALAHGPATRDQLVATCRALPDLDTLVLLDAVPGATPTTWRSPAPFVRVGADLVPEKITTFHKYRCAELR